MPACNINQNTVRASLGVTDRTRDRINELAKIHSISVNALLIYFLDRYARELNDICNQTLDPELVKRFGLPQNDQKAA